MVIIEIEAEVVRAKKSTKRGLVVPILPLSNPSTQNAHMVNVDLEQLFDLEETMSKYSARNISNPESSNEELLPVKYTDKRRRVLSQASKAQSTNEELIPAKNTAKCRPALSLASKSHSTNEKFFEALLVSDPQSSN